MAAQGESRHHFFAEDGASPWLSAWHRTTNFAIETVKQDWSLEPQFGRRTSVLIGRLGDLLTGATLEVTMTKKPNEFPVCVAGYHPMEALIKEVTLVIGGIEIERHTSDFFRVFDTFIRDPCKSAVYKSLTNFDGPTMNTAVESTETLALPLMFTFCRHLGNALPLIAMMDSEVRIWFEFADAEEVGVSVDNFSATVYADFVLLDTKERQWFAQNPHDYLIEQVQYNQMTLPDGVPSTDKVTTVKMPLRLFRPVKALYWVFRNTAPSTSTRTHHGRYVGDAANTYLAYQPNPFDLSQYGLLECISERLAPMLSATLNINGQARFDTRNGTYFQKIQPYNHLPKTVFPGMYSYSFALRPADLQPTGMCNFSTIDEAHLMLDIKKTTTAEITSSAFAGTKALDTAKNISELRDLLVMAVNYNIMRIEYGRAIVSM